MQPVGSEGVTVSQTNGHPTEVAIPSKTDAPVNGKVNGASEEHSDDDGGVDVEVEHATKKKKKKSKSRSKSKRGLVCHSYLALMSS